MITISLTAKCPECSHEWTVEAIQSDPREWHLCPDCAAVLFFPKSITLRTTPE